MIRDGIRDGSLRTSDVHVATYAILLQCTGVALWFDPRGPLGLEEVAELHVRAGARLAAGVQRADRRGDRERARGGGAGEPRASSRRPCPSTRRSRSSRRPARPRRAPRSSRRPPTSRRSGTRSCSAPTTARCTATWPAPTRSAPPTCSGRSASPASTWSTRSAAATATARLHDRIDWDSRRRPAHRLRLQRHHRAAPRARRPRRLGHASTGPTSCASRGARTS